jgi:hypothetical protein
MAAEEGGHAMKAVRAYGVGLVVAGVAWYGCSPIGSTSSSLALLGQLVLLPGLIISTAFQFVVLGRGGHGDGHYGFEVVLLSAAAYAAAVLIWQNRRREEVGSAVRNP